MPYSDSAVVNESASDIRVKTTPNPYVYGCLVALAAFWLWHVDVVLPKGLEAIGFDLGSAALPVFLLWFWGWRLKVAIKHKGIVAPYKCVLGEICAIWGALGLVDILQSTTAHRLGAFLLWGLFWSIALVLFTAAKVQQSRSQKARTDKHPIPLMHT